MPYVSDTSRIVRLFVPRSILNPLIYGDRVSTRSYNNDNVCLVFRMVGSFTGRKVFSMRTHTIHGDDDIETRLSKEHSRRSG
jgi:hypothetical protein